MFEAVNNPCLAAFNGEFSLSDANGFGGAIHSSLTVISA